MLNVKIIKRKEFLLEKGYHPFDSLIIVLEGTFNCTISQKRYRVMQNDIFVFNNGAYFERYIVVPIKCIYIQFDQFPFILNDGVMPIKDSVRMHNTILYLEKAIKEENHQHIKHFIDDIFITGGCCKSRTDICADEIVSACIDYLKECYNDSISLAMLTDKFHISGQWLIARFKKTTNKTPIEYLNDIRLHHGKLLLTDSDLSVSEIAVKCGFDNVYYFSNRFKKSTGMSPSQYRNNFRL